MMLLLNLRSAILCARILFQIRIGGEVDHLQREETPQKGFYSDEES